MRLGIVGGGFGLDAHLPAFNTIPGVDVVALADSGSGKVQARLPAGVAYAPSWRQLLDMDVDIVSVATPPTLQHEIVLAALACGKHVFCEKPFGGTLAQALSMADGARRSPACVVAVNFQFRYERGIALLKEKVATGLIGKPHAIDVSWLTAGRANPQSPWSWRNDASAGGGVLGAFFSHVADLSCWLADAEPGVVFGNTRILIAERRDDTGYQRSVTAEDAVSAQLEMDNGVLVSCRISNTQFGGDGMRIEVRGGSGMLTYCHRPPFAPEDQALTLRNRDGETLLSLDDVRKAGLAQEDSRTYAVNRCVADFVARIAGDASVQPPSLQDGVRVQRIMDAVRQSSLSRQPVVLEGCA